MTGARGRGAGRRGSGGYRGVGSGARLLPPGHRHQRQTRSAPGHAATKWSARAICAAQPGSAVLHPVPGGRGGELQRLGQPWRPDGAAARPLPRARNRGARGRLQVRQHQLRRRRWRFRHALRPGALSAGRTPTRCCAASSGWRPIRPTKRPWKRSRASAPRCATSRRTSELDDFAHAEPVHHIRPIPAPDHRRRRLEPAGARALGDLRRVPRGQELERGTGIERRRLHPGEFRRHRGARAGERQHSARARHRAGGRRHDPARRRHFPRAWTRRTCPAMPKWTRGVAGLAENVVALAHAPKGEDYNGPVLFEGVAGAADFRRGAGQEPGADPPAGERWRPRRRASSPANSKAASARAFCPIRSTWWTIPRRRNGAAAACSALTTWTAKACSPKPLQLVEKGVLKNYLLTRQPVRGFDGSNGRARLPGSFGASIASISNLFVSSSGHRAGGG